MREIIFRGKRTDNGEWVEGVYYKQTEFYGDKREEHYIITSSCAIENDLGLEYYEVIPETVGQFTGLTDKNEKKIFDGDIGRYKQIYGAKRNGKPIICTGKVIYNAENVSFLVESTDEEGCKYFDYFTIKDFEIIGNIYDNPELIAEREADEKRKKAKVHYEGRAYFCSSCGFPLHRQRNEGNYCSGCGAVLDWENMEVVE